MIMRLLILILVLSFLVITGTLVSADGHTLSMITNVRVDDQTDVRIR
jgi:hypothetical protein